MSGDPIDSEVLVPPGRYRDSGSRAMSAVGVLTALRCTSMVLADHGWPVLPGTYFHDGCWQGRPDSVGLRPIDENWTETWTTNPAQAARRWAATPYSVLLACGEGVDCLELPVRCAARMLAALAAADLFAPAMVTPAGGLVLFARTDRRARFPRVGHPPFGWCLGRNAADRSAG